MKVAEVSVIYLPAEIATPPDVAALEQKCKVKVKHLPRQH